MNQIEKYIRHLDHQAQLARTPRWVTPETMREYGFKVKTVNAPITLFLGEAVRMKTMKAPTIDLLVSKLKESCPDPVCLLMLYPDAKDRIAEAKGNYKIRYHLINQEDHSRLMENLVCLGEPKLDNTFVYKQPFDLNLEMVNTMMAMEGEQKAIEYIGQAVIEAIKREVNV